ncbi:unknown protein [Simkania negevensis Z]|uniref:Transposase n=1 Tax=Simkania negevensis (strain ATCC VR-1471 / DSM 27360 / Z) TaxID=331113 RepID=F8L4J4_SIMNZ|nr:unknown protein [Simkania negevensis Z]
MIGQIKNLRFEKLFKICLLKWFLLRIQRDHERDFKFRCFGVSFLIKNFVEHYLGEQ